VWVGGWGLRRGGEEKNFSHLNLMILVPYVTYRVIDKMRHTDGCWHCYSFDLVRSSIRLNPWSHALGQICLNDMVMRKRSSSLSQSHVGFSLQYEMAHLFLCNDSVWDVEGERTCGVAGQLSEA
jgi:hypothetical protein